MSIQFDRLSTVKMQDNKTEDIAITKLITESHQLIRLQRSRYPAFARQASKFGRKSNGLSNLLSVGGMILLLVLSFFLNLKSFRALDCSDKFGF